MIQAAQNLGLALEESGLLFITRETQMFQRDQFTLRDHVDSVRDADGLVDAAFATVADQLQELVISETISGRF